MSRISQYVDNMFYALPDTESVRAARETIAENLEEKYEDLLRSGCSEAEAFTQATEEFGTMEELCEALGLTKDPPVPPPNESRAQPDPFPPQPGMDGGMPAEDARLWAEYDEFRQRYAMANACGIGLILLGVVLFIPAQILFGEFVSVPLFMLFIAAAVFLFIFYGNRLSFYKERLQIESDRPMQMDGLPQNPHSRYMEAIQRGIMLLCTLFYLFIGFCWGSWHPGWIVFILGGALCTLLELLSIGSR